MHSKHHSVQGGGDKTAAHIVHGVIFSGASTDFISTCITVLNVGIEIYSEVFLLHYYYQVHPVN